MRGTRTVNEIVRAGGGADVRLEIGQEVAALPVSAPLEIDPFNVTTWPEEQQRNHRLRRALHELMADPRYTLEVGTKPDGTPGVRIRSEHGVTPEAQAFLTGYREEFITYLSWLEGVDGYSGVQGDVPLSSRKAA